MTFVLLLLVAKHVEGRCMFGIIWGLTARAHYFFRRFMPTNIALDAIHTRRGLKWAVPAMLVAVPYALAAALCAGLVETGGSGWLNVLTVLFVWNALKFVVAGPAALLRLLAVRRREARARRLTGADSPEIQRVQHPARSLVRT
jgi:small-conductance mechanosensitive channel